MTQTTKLSSTELITIDQLVDNTVEILIAQALPMFHDDPSSSRRSYKSAISKSIKYILCLRTFIHGPPAFFYPPAAQE